MIDSLKQLFAMNKKSTESDNGEALRLAAATIMYELVEADGQVDEVELKVLVSSLKDCFQLTDEETSELLANAKRTAAESTSLQNFTRLVCENWDNPSRLQLLEYLWRIAYADQRIDSHERHLVRKIAGLLYLTDRQIAVVKERVKTTLSFNTESDGLFH